MVMEGIRWLEVERQHKTSSADERETAKQACAALKKPQSVAGPRSAAENGRRSKAQGPRQEVTPGREVSNENATVGMSLVIVQDRHEDTEPHTDDAEAEATSEVRFCCYICLRILNGDEQYQHHMQLRHRSKKRRRHWGGGGGAALPDEKEKMVGANWVVEDTEISEGAFMSMVALMREPGASIQTIEILTVMAGLLHKKLPDDMRIQEGSSPGAAEPATTRWLDHGSKVVASPSTFGCRSPHAEKQQCTPASSSSPPPPSLPASQSKLIFIIINIASIVSSIIRIISVIIIITITIIIIIIITIIIFIISIILITITISITNIIIAIVIVVAHPLVSC
jgi:hypothetical protein